MKMTMDTQIIIAEIASAADQITTLLDALKLLNTAGEVEAGLLEMALATTLRMSNDIDALADAI
jgi:hypothetical protein